MDKQEIINSLNLKTFYTSEIPSFKANGSNMGQALCPWHNDTKPSLTINLSTGQFKCFGCDNKGSVFDFYMKKYSVDYKTAFNALAKEAGLTTEAQKKVVKTYDYVDESGKLLFQTVRYEPKDFKQRRPEGKGGWIYNLQGVQLVPYNLSEVIKSKSIIICEGEKDVNNLKALGLTASCNPMGAGKWRPEYNQWFKGKKVVLIPDNDDPGRKHAQAIAKNLKSITESVKVVELPDLKGKDVTDWIQAGGTKERLIEIIKDTSEWIPQEPKSLLSSLLKWNDILSLDVRTEYILEKLIPRNSITLLFGRGGIGKTSLCMQIARAIASGLSFDVLKTIASPVYYIDFENPLAVLKERVEKIGQAENLYVWHISNEILQPPKLDSTGWELYKQLPPGLLIVDTLRASHLSDENDSKPMSLIMGRLKEFREMGFTILLLHHTPKGNDNTFKGSTALLDLCDHVLGLEEVKDSENETIEFDCRNLFKLGTRIKTRYEPHSNYLTFNPEIKGFSVAVDPDIEKMEGIQEILNQAVEPLKQKELREKINKEMDLPDKEIRKLLKKGTGLYWNTEKGNKNATIYTPINSVCQFGNTIYTRQTDKQESQEPENRTNRPSSNINKPLVNTEFGSLSEGSGQTDKQTVIDLEHEEVEIVE